MKTKSLNSVMMSTTSSWGQRMRILKHTVMMQRRPLESSLATEEYECHGDDSTPEYKLFICRM